MSVFLSDSASVNGEQSFCLLLIFDGNDEDIFATCLFGWCLAMNWTIRLYIKLVNNTFREFT
jgi:hypothetical protein